MHQVGDLVYLKKSVYDFWGVPHDARLIVGSYYREKDRIVYLVLDPTANDCYDYIEPDDMDKRRKWKLAKK